MEDGDGDDWADEGNTARRRSMMAIEIDQDRSSLRLCEKSGDYERFIHFQLIRIYINESFLINWLLNFFILSASAVFRYDVDRIR